MEVASPPRRVRALRRHGTAPTARPLEGAYRTAYDEGGLLEVRRNTEVPACSQQTGLRAAPPPRRAPGPHGRPTRVTRPADARPARRGANVHLDRREQSELEDQWQLARRRRSHGKWRGESRLPERRCESYKQQQP